MLEIPAVSDPHRYTGLYVYDFGDHVSIGYTAGELQALRRSAAYSSGTAYEIYRVTEQGGFELRGVSDDRLSQYEAMAFLRAAELEARTDCRQLVALATASPLSVPAEVRLLRCTEFRFPFVTGLIYPARSAHALSGWLLTQGYGGGDEVLCGHDVHATLALVADADCLESHTLATLWSHTDRSNAEVLASVDTPVQR